MGRVLFLSYDGLLEDIGQSQILRYCERLAPRHRITLLTCEKPSDLADSAAMARAAARLADLGVAWTPLRYHKAPPVLSTAWDLLRMLAAALPGCRKGAFDVVHARSTPPAAVALALHCLAGTPFIFDMKGFWAEQRLETGAWRPGPVFDAARRVQDAAIRRARFVVSETDAGIEALRSRGACDGMRGAFHVVPTCVDVGRFSLGPHPGPGFTLGFVGSFGAGYLLDPMVQAFRHLREAVPEARFRLVTRADHARFEAAFRRQGIADGCYSIGPARPDQVPGELASLHGGVYFLAPSPAMKAVCPTKLPELLAAGVPVLTGPGIGDTEKILRERGVGVVVDPADGGALRGAVGEFLRLARSEGIRARCRRAALELLDVSRGVRVFDELYSAKASSA